MARKKKDRRFQVYDGNGYYKGKMTYRAYLQSPWWKQRSRAAMARAGWKCQSCGRKDQLTVHHKSYSNLGNEIPFDLECLCWPCHKKEHPEKNKKRKNKKRKRRKKDKRGIFIFDFSL